MINKFRQEILKLNHKLRVDKKISNKFLERLNLGRLIKQQNPADHFCSFFLPVNTESKSIYLGHHIKADDWIPPGGHIKLHELPIETVKREFVEELQYKLNKERVELFDLTIKDVSGNPKHSCKIHYDFWYLVYINKFVFNFDKSEFYQAEWLTIPEALTKMKLTVYANVVKKISGII